ncbi:hypothetical protein ACVWXB_007666 [Streptomyces sp. TE12347]
MCGALGASYRIVMLGQQHSPRRGLIDPLHGWIHGGRGRVACVASGFVWVVG